MKASIAVIFSAILLAGCQSNPVADLESPYYRPPVGSLVRVEQQLRIAPGQARVFLQRGEVVNRHGRDQYVPSCGFEVRKVLETPQYVEPGEFSVVRVSYPQLEEVVQRGPLLHAGLQVGDSVDGGGSTMIIYGIHMHVESEQQPEVMRVSCYGGLDDPWLSRPPSVAEMRTALGGFASLILPGDPVAQPE